jgi:adenylate kinase
MIVAITGTPGTGKKSAGRVLSSLGKSVMSVEEIAREHGLLEGEECEIDTERLRHVTSDLKGEMYITGHLAHYTAWSVGFVLRCQPSVLYARLRERGWSEEKILENVRAEVLDVILAETVELGKHVFEIDTTHATPEKVADAILNEHSDMRKRPGSISWFSEVEHWFSTG